MCVCVYCRSLALGTKTGYKLFSLTMVEKLDCIHESGQYGALCFSMSYIFIHVYNYNNYICAGKKGIKHTDFFW